MADAKPTEKLKGSDTDRETAARAHGRRLQPGAQGAGRGADAIPSGHVDEQKLKENQRRLNVGNDHKTPEMKKRRRGTFP